MSRIRQIKPSWFLDKELRRGTTADAREFYIGLWMLADDDGWLVWDEERIAAELYPYDPDRRRERNIQKWSDQLERLNPDAPHLVVLDCGHATVPKMKAHQRIAGNRTTKVRESHSLTCRNTSSRLSLQVATPPLEPHVATRSPGIGIGRERNVTVGNGIAREAPPEGGPAPESEFQRQVPKLAALKP